MEHLLIKLSIGVLASFLAYVLVYRMTTLRAYQATLVVIVAMLCVFLPLQIIFWDGADVFAIQLALFVIVPYGLGIITSQWEASRGSGRKGGRWFHWAPATIVGFFFVIASVDATIIYLANNGMPSHLVGTLLPEPRGGAQQVTSHFPGTVINDHFRKETQYSEYLDRVLEQRERGWQVSQGWLQAPRHGQPATFQVKVTDRDGHPLSDVQVYGMFARPSDARDDTGFELQSVSPGVFQGAVALPLPGAWEVFVRVRRGDEVHEQRGMTSVREG
ncbi:FixH family protein [Thioalkalivibrio sulfidiphilus]|uniref:FixH family protein n=1 Tax=Thioalkalivibrio sulfidiphilus TaxID=1033854 RepID=UPI00036028EA|nr:FixH family protein [Thioalkalivibrio sulfidiphilus]